MTNSFGKIFRFTTFGESHGLAIGAVIDGVPSNVPLTEDDIQPYLDKRRPGQSKFTTQRQEPDKCQILSGTFDGKTTGTPICVIIYNQDQKSGDYNEIAKQFRPSHADYTYQEKYGIRDYRGGGRSSARETASRVIAGAVAQKALNYLGYNIDVTGYLTQIGQHKISNIDCSEIENNDFFSPDKNAVAIWADYLNEIRKNGSSVGAMIEVVAKGVPACLGEPIYGKLDSDLAAALMTINAVKSVEIGDGVLVAGYEAKDNVDEMRMESGQVQFLSNHAGGILGGIATGQDIVARVAIKPTSSVLTPFKSVDMDGNNIEVRTKGRHDPCVGIRGVPVVEAMVRCVILDHILRLRSYK
jgi:chorismate synthase